MTRPPWVLDTREQDDARGWGDYLTGPVIRATLSAGDLAIDGYADRWAIERKTGADYLGCLTHGRERFLGDGGQVHRLAAMEFGAIIVEASLEDLLTTRRWGRVHPSSVIGSTAKIVADLGVPVMFAGSIARSADLAMRLLSRLYDAHAAKVAA